ncbi:hypothetical protein [Sphingomonas sp. Marseille-Q8236]|jgi:hypothetical protein
MSVDPLFAQWLQAQADYVVVSDAAGLARWAATAVTASRTTSIATKEAAQAEAARQLAFFSRGPFAIDVHEFASTDWLETIGLVVTISNDDLGYADGIDVFVLGVESDAQTGISAVTVLRPLKGVS